MNDNFKVYLQAIIDDSSLSQIQKDLAKKKLEIQADIDLSNFAKSKADIEKQFKALSGIIKDILGDAVSDKQAAQWAKQYYKEIESGAKQAVKEQEKLNAAQKKSTLAEQESYYKRIIENTKQIYSLKNKLITADTEQTEVINKQLKALEERNRYNYSQLDKKGLSDDGWERQVNNSRVTLENQLKINQAKQIDIANSKTLASINDKSQEIQFSIDTEKYSTQINTFKQQLSKFGSESGEIFDNAQLSLKHLESAYDGMKSSNGDKRLEYEKEYQKSLETTKNLLNQIKSQKSNELISNGDNRRVSFINELNNYLQKNTAMTKQSKQQIIELINTLNSVDDMTRGTFDNLRAQFKGLDADLRATNKLGLSWTDKFKQAVEKFGGWAIATGSVMELWNLFRRMPKEVYNIDTSMTNLYKVTDETERKYSEFLDNASSKAQALGRSISGLVEQTADWAKLGFNIDEASELAQISSVYSNVGEVDDATAVSDLVTAMKSFNIEASDSITIVDSLNKLGNEFATDSASLGEGLKKSASALSLAGNDINQTLAMITGGTEITQNASEMGNALKVLSMRVRGMKGALEELGEEYENVESISKIQTQILNQTNGAVNIFDKNGNFKSTYEILKGISKVWSDISQVDQAALLETIAGKQRGNQISALIQAFQSGQIEKAYEASVNSAGSAMQEQERWMESLEAKTQQLEAAYQSLSTTVLDSDFLKVLADSGITLTNVLDTVIGKIGIIPTIATGGSIAALIKNFDWPWNKGYLKIA